LSDLLEKDMLRATLPLALLCAAFVALRTVFADPAAEAYISGDKNELSEALEGLGVDAAGNPKGMDAYIQSTIQAAMKKAEKERAMEEDDDYIPQPDPPAGMNTFTESSLDEDDDEEETDYFKLRKIKEFYPRKGDVVRLTNKNFDDEIFDSNYDFGIVVFYAKFCKMCKHHAPSIRAAGRRYKEDPRVLVAAVNQENNIDLSARFDLEPAQETVYYFKKGAQTDGDLKEYNGEISFAALLQFIGSEGAEMMEQEKYVPTLYKDSGPSKHVRQDLNVSNFNETVFNPKKHVMLQFYAGWSEFCQIDAKNFTVLAARMRRDHPDEVTIAAIDVDKQVDLADRFDISQLPAYWFASKDVTEDTQLLKYTGNHQGAITMEELYPFILSGGKTIPDGMKDEKPIHPPPWHITQAKMQKEKAEAKEKDEKEKVKQEAEAKKRKEARVVKKKEMAEKKAAKEKAKSEL